MALCRAARTTRQNYYKQRRIRQRRHSDETLVLELVGQQRAMHPMLGGRKLLHLIGGELAAAGVEMGRDRFFALLERHDLLIPRKRNWARTTQSRHGFEVFRNLARDLDTSGPHQLLISDITYLRTDEGFMYLSLVSDAFSRKIVGHDCSDSLEMEGALRALEMALKQLPAAAKAVHHSDRGIQYCCRAYVQRLKERGLRISMTEENHCYENGQAERLNGILKQEYGLGRTFGQKGEVFLAVRQAVQSYNERRPHLALGYRTPAEAHATGGGKTRMTETSCGSCRSLADEGDHHQSRPRARV